MSKDTTLDTTETISEAKQVAINSGWVPEEQWEGDPDTWVDYKEFNYRGELFDRIKRESHSTKKLTKELEEVREALQQLAEHNKKLAKIDYERTMRTLKKQKTEALREDDFDAVASIDDDILELKTRQQQAEKEEITLKPKGQERQPTPEDVAYVQLWQEKNEGWYNANRAMTALANTIGIEYSQENPLASAREVLTFVDNEMRKEFPDKFRSPKPTGSPVIGSATTTGNAKRQGKPTEGQLTDEQRRVGRTFVKQGVFNNLDEFAAQLAEIGELA